MRYGVQKYDLKYNYEHDNMFLAYFQSKIEYVPEEERISTNADEVMRVCIIEQELK